MNLRSLTMFVALLCVAQVGTAFAVDCRMERMVVTMQNTTALDKYNSAWKEFNAKFSKDEAALRRHAAILFTAWKPISDKWPQAFVNAAHKRATEKYDTNPANYFARVTEEELARKYPKLGLTVNPLIKTDVAPDGTSQGKSLTLDANGDPMFEICIDDLRPIPEGVSFACGTVTPGSTPDQKGFADGYLATIKSSRVVNGSPDLAKPQLATVAAGCADAAKNGQASDSKVSAESGDVTSTKNAGGGQQSAAEATPAARAVEHDVH